MVPSWSIGLKYIVSALKFRLQVFWSCWRLGPKTYRVCLSATVNVDEPAHLVPTYTILFSPLYHFPSIVDTPAMQCACATTHVTSVSLRDRSLTPLALICPINLSHHRTGFAHGMYRWPTDLIVTFSFLDWSPHCFFDDYFFFQLTDLPPWYVTVSPSYLTHPDVCWPVSSHCAMQLVSQETVAISPQMILVLVFSWQVFFYLITCNFFTQQRSFPESLDSAKCVSLIHLVHSSLIVLLPCLIH